MSSYFIPQSIASLLKCSCCKKYLSIPPITATSEYSRCGRCNSHTPSGISATAYEILAKTTKFPCIYDNEGCNNYSNFGQQCQNHEQKCPFRTIKCPLEPCNLEIRLPLILKHCQEAHEDLLITSGTFRLPYGDGFVTRNVIVLDGDVFLLLGSSNDGKWGIALKSLETNTKKDIFYQLAIKSETSEMVGLKKQKIALFKTTETTNDLIYFDKEPIKSVLKGDTFELEIRLVCHEMANDAERGEKKVLLDELECIVCNEIMAPPIYSCTIGHSVCCQCRNKIDKCPTCQAQYLGTRNFPLEKLTEFMTYPCKNQINGCNFTGTPRKLCHHEDNDCPVKLICCPLSLEMDCSWKGVFQRMSEHMNNCHLSHFNFRLNTVRLLDFWINYDKHLYVVLYKEEIFKVFIRQEVGFQTSWAVEHAGLKTSENAKFLFVLNFSDQTGMGCVLTISGICCGYEENTFESGVRLNYNLLKNFIRNDGKLVYGFTLKEVAS